MRSSVSLSISRLPAEAKDPQSHRWPQLPRFRKSLSPITLAGAQAADDREQKSGASLASAERLTCARYSGASTGRHMGCVRSARPKAFAANSFVQEGNSVNEAVPGLQNLSSFEVKFAPFRRGSLETAEAEGLPGTLRLTFTSPRSDRAATRRACSIAIGPRIKVR